MRGLKSVLSLFVALKPDVASYTDAWIEIFCFRACSDKTKYVASYTDAWIEIETSSYEAETTAVASYTDAWIEIKIKSPFLA